MTLRFVRASMLRSVPAAAHADRADADRHFLLRPRRPAAGVLHPDRLRRRRARAPAPCRSSCRPASPIPRACSTSSTALIVSGGGDINPTAYGGAPARDGLLGLRGARRLRVRAHPRRARRHARAAAVHLPRPAGAQRRLRRHAARASAGALRRARRPPAAAARHQRARGADRPRQPAGADPRHHARRRCAPGITRRSTGSATGLRAVAWAEDGVVEAVEHVVHPWCIGVQWHPEMQLDDGAQQNIFKRSSG